MSEPQLPILLLNNHHHTTGELKVNILPVRRFLLVLSLVYLNFYGYTVQVGDRLLYPNITCSRDPSDVSKTECDTFIEVHSIDSTF